MSNPLIARFAGEPALMEPGSSERFKASLDAVMSHEFAGQALVSTAAAGDDFWTELGDFRSEDLRPYNVVDGVLHIPVREVHLKDFPYAFFDWATGYEYIRAAFERGMDDGNVKAVALVIDSPGGMVSGNFDLVDRMYARQGEKPVRAFLNEHAYSAAYSIASVADSITLPRTGGAGSIGVVTSHVDQSEALAKYGLKVTFIHAGKHKVDGNSYEPLPAEVKARIQERIDEIYDLFVATVARNRPALTEEAVRATEALTFSASQAVSNGLADTIGTLEDAQATLVADLSATEGTEQMATEPNTPAADHAAHEAAVATARTEGHAAGQSAERARITGILGSEPAKDRPAAALAAALETDMSLEQATAFLAKLKPETVEAPAAEAESAGETLDAPMLDTGGGPKVGALTTPTEEAKDDGSDITALAAKAGVSAYRHLQTA